MTAAHRSPANGHGPGVAANIAREAGDPAPEPSRVGYWPFADIHPENGMPAPAPVQTAALNFGLPKYKVGYWLEQGLAKTAVDLAHFVHDVQQDLVDAHVVVVPSYLKSGWVEEAALWKMKAPVIAWPNVVPERIKRHPYIFVINYEAVLYGGGKHLESLLRERRHSITLDESSAIKNFNGMQSRQVRQIAQACDIKRALSGTPMSLNVMDLYAQLRYLGELNGVNPYQFRNRFAVMGGYMGKQVKGVRNEEELHEILGRCTFRALKRDWWAGAPKKIYMAREFEMTKKQTEAYQSMLTDFFYEVKEDDHVYANQVIHAKMKMQQISRGFLIDAENDRVVELVTPGENPALRVVRATLDETPGKMLIFTVHTYSTGMLEEALRKRGVVVLRGSMSPDAIAEVKQRFNEDPDTRILIGQESVAARGHTLLGKPGPDRCSNSIFFENRYALEVRQQLEDRNHRFGQDQDVGYFDLFCCREDRAVVKALQDKISLVEAVVNAVRAFPRVRLDKAASTVL